MRKIILFVLILLLSGCIPNIETPVIVGDGDVLGANICERLNEKVIVIHKTGCPACAIAIPVLEELEKELNKEFIYFNTAVDEDRTKLLSLGFVPRYVPTVVVDCKVYAGVLEKEKYKGLISEWLAV